MKMRLTILNRSRIERVGKFLRWLVCSAFVLLSLLALIYYFGGRHVGALHARLDIWRGKYEIHGYGFRLGINYKAKIFSEHGIVYRHVAGCMVNKFIMESIASYNEVMKHAIKQNIGKDLEGLTYLND